MRILFFIYFNAHRFSKLHFVNKQILKTLKNIYALECQRVKDIKYDFNASCVRSNVKIQIIGVLILNALKYSDSLYTEDA